MYNPSFHQAGICQQNPGGLEEVRVPQVCRQAQGGTHPDLFHGTREEGGDPSRGDGYAARISL